ncbi:hypothetical protein TNCV_1446041 [Trichonephila clavipes]|nr:hypothetical protein TNCV_1446041 [Trichonephila clavipes]
MKTLEMPSKVYEESTMVISKVYESHQRFKEDRFIVDDEHGGRPTSRNSENVRLVSEYVRKDRRQTLA